ncbi:DUF5392 family protein [Evansella sp. AB-rgal1]|uniref:DUF5392 family protein n=1 Tax=Evansella sp. AB-rgal1 TaxID=3242696 RepID=UPI00359CD138
MDFSKKDYSSEKIKKEFEELNALLKPFVRKSLLYGIISAPLLSVSIVNLFYLLLIFSAEYSILIPGVIFSITGALGVALFKEALHQNKEARKMTMTYIKARITNSKHVNYHSKADYLMKLEQNKKDFLHIFIQFLKYEDRMKDINTQE